jgi:hypothetical protein
MNYKEEIVKLINSIDNNDFRLKIILRFIKKMIG